MFPKLFIILFLHQTTTHHRCCMTKTQLFIILFLHQTTTLGGVFMTNKGCLSSCSYIKPQPPPKAIFPLLSCLSSCSYIKPQRWSSVNVSTLVVYHLVPTSNHNPSLVRSPSSLLFIILFLHQTTTVLKLWQTAARLFIILFLHQTTTPHQGARRLLLLFIILFLHQTTTCKGSDILLEIFF